MNVGHATRLAGWRLIAVWLLLAAEERNPDCQDIVEAMQIEIGGGPIVLGRPLEGPIRLLFAPVYRGIRAVTTLVGGGLDVALARFHYNTGLHISTNGRALAAIVDQLVAEWPVPLDEVVILGHSLGGLVSRSACHYAEVAGHAWRRKLGKLVCLGSPHQGAPFERGGHWVDVLLGASRHAAPLARLGQIRSAGVTDMRFGNVLDDDWEGRDRFGNDGDRRTPLPLPAGVDCYAIAATSTTSAMGPGVALASDGLVPVDSALGRSENPELSLRFPESHQWIAFGAAHLDLLDRADVYAKIASWL